MLKDRLIAESGRRPEIYLTEGEAAAVLGIAPRTVRLWRHTRGLPHVAVTPKVIRIPRSDLDDWLRSRMVRTVA